MPGFPTHIVGTPTNRGKARRYEGEKKGTMYRAPRKASAPPRMAVPRCRGSRKCLRGDGDDAKGAAGAAYDLERRGDDYGAGERQLIEIAKAGEAKLSAAVHDEMI